MLQSTDSQRIRHDLETEQKGSWLDHLQRFSTLPMCQAACQPQHTEKDRNWTCPHRASMPMEDSETKKINDEFENIADMLSAMKETHRAETCMR